MTCRRYDRVGARPAGGRRASALQALHFLHVLLLLSGRLPCLALSNTTLQNKKSYRRTAPVILDNNYLNLPNSQSWHLLYSLCRFYLGNFIDMVETPWKLFKKIVLSWNVNYIILIMFWSHQKKLCEKSAKFGEKELRFIIESQFIIIVKKVVVDFWIRYVSKKSGRYIRILLLKNSGTGFTNYLQRHCLNARLLYLSV